MIWSLDYETYAWYLVYIYFRQGSPSGSEEALPLSYRQSRFQRAAAAASCACASVLISAVCDGGRSENGGIAEIHAGYEFTTILSSIKKKKKLQQQQRTRATQEQTTPSPSTSIAARPNAPRPEEPSYTPRARRAHGIVPWLASASNSVPRVKNRQQKTPPPLKYPYHRLGNENKC